MEVADPKRFFAIITGFLAVVGVLVYFFAFRSSEPKPFDGVVPASTPVPVEVSTMYKALQETPRVVVTGFLGGVRNKVVIDKTDNRLLVYTNGQMTLYVNDNKRYDYTVATKCFARTVLPETSSIIKDYSASTLSLPKPADGKYDILRDGTQYSIVYKANGDTVTIKVDAATSLPKTVDITGQVSQKTLFKYPTTVPVVKGTKKCD